MSTPDKKQGNTDPKKPAPNDPKKNVPVKKDDDNDATEPGKTVNDPSKTDPTRIDDPRKTDPTRID